MLRMGSRFALAITPTLSLSLLLSLAVARRCYMFVLGSVPAFVLAVILVFAVGVTHGLLYVSGR